MLHGGGVGRGDAHYAMGGRGDGRISAEGCGDGRGEGCGHVGLRFFHKRDGMTAMFDNSGFDSFDNVFARIMRFSVSLACLGST